MNHPADSDVYDPEKIYSNFPTHRALFKAFYEGSKQGKTVVGEIKEYPSLNGQMCYEFDFSNGTSDTKENFKRCIDTFLDNMSKRIS